MVAIEETYPYQSAQPCVDSFEQDVRYGSPQQAFLLSDRWYINLPCKSTVTQLMQGSGIHNQPIVPWDGAPFENKNYCMHSTPNFPTWHRPYVALLEVN